MEKVPGRKRKTVLYYKKLVRKAGMDYTNIGVLTGERKEWKRRVNMRMKHLEKWERQRGNKNLDEKVERSNRMEEVNDLKWNWEECGKIGMSKAGLAVHRRRMHEISSHKVIFKCDKCNLSFQQEANLLNHAAKCGGAASTSDKRKCPKCNREFSRNIARHRNTCRREEEDINIPQE